MQSAIGFERVQQAATAAKHAASTCTFQAASAASVRVWAPLPPCELYVWAPLPPCNGGLSQGKRRGNDPLHLPTRASLDDMDGVKCCGAPAAPAGAKSKSAGWDSMASFYQHWMSPGTASIACSLFGHAGLLTPGSEPLRVLETHCGDARAATGLLPSPSVASYTVSDFSEGMLTAARNNLGDKASVVNADATQLPFEDGSFDRYISNLGLCCTPNLTAYLEEARRVLAPGGMAVISARIEGGDGDSSFKLVQQALSPFGLPAGPEREGLRLGKDLPALRSRLEGAGFSRAVAWRTWATLPIHDVESFMLFATGQPPIQKFLGSLDQASHTAALEALRGAAGEALHNGAIQVAAAVVVAHC